MSTRAISFSVLISSLVIITFILPRPSTIFGLFLRVFSGTVEYFCFTVLPFSLSLAPYIFIKCLRPLVKFWSFDGVKIVVFLVDGCGKEIFLWKNNVSLNARPIVSYEALYSLSSVSDGSNVACGAYLGGTGVVSHRMWKSSEAEKSST